MKKLRDITEAKVGWHMRQKLNAAARDEHTARGFNKNTKEGAWSEHKKFEWHDKQTDKAVHFPTHGWAPKSAIGFKHKETGEIRGWANAPASGDIDKHHLVFAGWLKK